MSETNRHSLRVWIVDDHPGFRRDLAVVLERRGVVCERVLPSARGLFAELASGPQPDALLLDLRMPGIDGIEALTEIRATFPELVVLMLTASDEEDDLLSAIRAGASGYLLKTSTPGEIETAIRRSLRGGIAIDPDMGRHLVDQLPGGTPDEAAALSPKEEEVLRHLAEGKPTKQIASEMGLSIHTVDTHLRNLYRKLEAPNQSAAVARAFRLGLLR
ncbi:MAG: response regulator transcription factor [Verrucomicrobiota bacterium]